MVFRVCVLLFVFVGVVTSSVNASDSLEERLSYQLDSIINEYSALDQRSEYVKRKSEMDDTDKKAETIVIISFLFIAVGGVIYIKHAEKTRYNHIWQKDVFNKKRPLKQDDLLEAYMRLGVKMIIKDRVDVGEKLKYLNTYLRRYFPKSDYDFEEILKSSYRNPISLTTVSKWLNFHLKDPAQKSQLLYFLGGLSVVDGSLEPREEKMLYDLGQLLHLSLADIRSVISMYQRRSAPNDSTTNSNSEKAKLLQMIEQASSMLNVSTNASIDEVKKAYRRMVKLHHPDKFMGHSEEQQQIAHERFLHIQRAYELLEKCKISSS